LFDKGEIIMATATMHRTKNDLPEELRAQVIEILNKRLADSIDLQYQAKQAHWNVKGEQFRALHELFDEVATAAIEYTDLIAERVTQLGGTAYGTVRVAASNSSLNEYPLEIFDGHSHVEAVSNALSTYAANIRRDIDQTTELQDAGTADLFTEIVRGVDKNLWFVEAHNQVRND
jgi:starvation-inducible DNA-binding protein